MVNKINDIKYFVVSISPASLPDWSGAGTDATRNSCQCPALRDLDKSCKIHVNNNQTNSK